jgi:hypothetical protein
VCEDGTCIFILIYTHTHTHTQTHTHTHTHTHAQGDGKSENHWYNCGLVKILAHLALSCSTPFCFLYWPKQADLEKNWQECTACYLAILRDTSSSSPVYGSLPPRHGASSGCGWRNDLQLWRVAASILNKQSRTADKGWYSCLGVGRGDNNSSS